MQVHRFQKGRGLVFIGAAGDTESTGRAVVAYFRANPCTQNSVQVVTDFQNAWNSNNPGDELQVDGRYGPLTQGALENALNTTDVPPNCFGGVVPKPSPSPSPTPSPTPNNTTVVNNPSSPVPYLIGAGVVAAALAAYTYSRSSKKKRRRHV